MANNLQRLKSDGYSNEVLNHLAKARQKSTNTTYESKWRLFHSFCQEKSIDAFNATPATVAEFLYSVATDRNLTFSTLAGYRAAIGRVLKLTTGYDPGSDPILHQQMQSFKRTQPVAAKRIPSWDIGFVLNTLNSEQFNNREIDLKTLTAKTIFLTALATGERRGAVAAIHKDANLTGEDGIVLKFDPSFVPKSYYMKKNVSRINDLFIPFLKNVEFSNICPADAILTYIKRASHIRSPKQTSLFIQHDESKTKNITPQSIAFYILHCIRFCYDATGMRRPSPKCHDVRKIAASLRALTAPSLTDVLEAGQWSSASTFLKHYFVDLANNNVPTCVAGRTKFYPSFPDAGVKEGDAKAAEVGDGASTSQATPPPSLTTTTVVRAPILVDNTETYTEVALPYNPVAATLVSKYDGSQTKVVLIYNQSLQKLNPHLNSRQLSFFNHGMLNLVVDTDCGEQLSYSSLHDTQKTLEEIRREQQQHAAQQQPPSQLPVVDQIEIPLENMLDPSNITPLSLLQSASTSEQAHQQ